jgi:uncharacterized OB-fold protein
VTTTVLDDDLRDTPDGIRLVGGRCTTCGTVAFPRPQSCARCAGTDVADHLLAAEGSLWTFTIQGFRPKEPYDGPEEFEPYGVGYVDLAGELLVEGRLTVGDASRLRIGQPVRLVLLAYGTAPDGSTLHSYAFEPIKDPA